MIVGELFFKAIASVASLFFRREQIQEPTAVHIFPEMKAYSSLSDPIVLGPTMHWSVQRSQFTEFHIRDSTAEAPPCTTKVCFTEVRRQYWIPPPTKLSHSNQYYEAPPPRHPVIPIHLTDAPLHVIEDAAVSPAACNCSAHYESALPLQWRPVLLVVDVMCTGCKSLEIRKKVYALVMHDKQDGIFVADKPFARQ